MNFLTQNQVINYYKKESFFTDYLIYIFFFLFCFLILIEGIPVKSLRQKLNKVEIVEPLVNMVIDSKYPILQNEGIIALTLLSMDDTAKSQGMY